jgi:hypothetical protein
MSQSHVVSHAYIFPTDCHGPMGTTTIIIQDEQHSNFGPETGVSWFSSVLPGKFCDNTLKYNTTAPTIYLPICLS